MKDVTNSLCYSKRGAVKDGVVVTWTLILPFIFMARKRDDDLGDAAVVQDIVWLEWSSQCPPSPTDVFQTKTISKNQTEQRYMSLRAIPLSDREHTYAAIAARIVDGEIIFAKVGSGCLWGMIPRE